MSPAIDIVNDAAASAGGAEHSADKIGALADLLAELCESSGLGREEIAEAAALLLGYAIAAMSPNLTQAQGHASRLSSYLSLHLTANWLRVEQSRRRQ